MQKIKHQHFRPGIFCDERVMNLHKRLIYPVGTTEAIGFAARYLRLPLVDHPTPDATHLLLDVPLRQTNVEKILDMLPPDITVIGGNLNLPNYRCLDLLQDPEYLARNAAITAHCAVKLALPYLTVTLEHCPVLILGWGRIGKCLARLLANMGAEVTVAARKEADRAMLRALGYRACDYPELPKILHCCRLIYNTVPEKILSESTTFCCDCVKIELASQPGLPGDVIDGRGLPGKLAPESSGRLIADTILRRI